MTVLQCSSGLIHGEKSRTFIPACPYLEDNSDMELILYLLNLVNPGEKVGVLHLMTVAALRFIVDTLTCGALKYIQCPYLYWYISPCLPYRTQKWKVEAA